MHCTTQLATRGSKGLDGKTPITLEFEKQPENQAAEDSTLIVGNIEQTELLKIESIL